MAETTTPLQRYLLQQLVAITSGRVNMHGRKIVNAAKSVKLQDYVTRQELENILAPIGLTLEELFEQLYFELNGDGPFYNAEWWQMLADWLGDPLYDFSTLQEWGDFFYFAWNLVDPDDVTQGLYNNNEPYPITITDSFRLANPSAPGAATSVVCGDANGWLAFLDLADFAESDVVESIFTWLGAAFDDYDTLQEWGDANYSTLNSWFDDGFGGLYTNYESVYATNAVDRSWGFTWDNDYEVRFSTYFGEVFVVTEATNDITFRGAMQVEESVVVAGDIFTDSAVYTAGGLIKQSPVTGIGAALGLGDGDATFGGRFYDENEDGIGGFTSRGETPEGWTSLAVAYQASATFYEDQVFWYDLLIDDEILGPSALRVLAIQISGV